MGGTYKLMDPPDVEKQLPMKVTEYMLDRLWNSIMFALFGYWAMSMVVGGLICLEMSVTYQVIGAITLLLYNALVMFILVSQWRVFRARLLLLN